MSRDRIERVLHVRPRTVGLAWMAVATLFVVARLLFTAEGDVSRFVLAGEAHTDAAAVPVHLHVAEGDGYDGVFYWRLAVDPTELHVPIAYGVRFDDKLRAGRIAYPAVAWVVSFGSADLAATALVVVNVIAMGLLAWAGAVIARRSGRSAWWGLLVASATGLVFSLSRDLNEVVMAACVVGGIAALQARRRWWWAAAAWSVAALAHEQSLYVVAAYAAWRCWGHVTRRTRPAGDDLVWVLPVVAFVAWQVTAATQVGGWPVFGSSSASVGAPFVGLGREVLEAARGNVSLNEWPVVPQLFAAIIASVAAVRSRAGVDARERWLVGVLAAGIVLTVCLSYNVWVGPADLRQMALLPTMAGVVLVTSKRPIPMIVPLAVAGAWVLTAGLRVMVI